MNEDNFHLWKIKHQLAVEGSYQSIQEIKSHVVAKENDPLNISQANFFDFLKNSKIHSLKAATSHRTYQTYKQMPVFLILKGSAEIRFINLQADTQSLQKVEEKGYLGVNISYLEEKFGKENINLLTKFEFVATSDCVVIETAERPQITNKKSQNSEKQFQILKKFLLFPTKENVKIKVAEKTVLKDKFYLLSGKACYYSEEGEKKTILVAYTEGYFNPQQFSQNEPFKLFVFEDSEIMYLEEEFIKDEFVKSLEKKRLDHLQEIKTRYKELSLEERERIQEKLIIKYRLPRKTLESKFMNKKDKRKDEKLNKSEKKVNSKTDLTSTSSSIKCAIRIRKSKKIN